MRDMCCLELDVTFLDEKKISEFNNTYKTPKITVLLHSIEGAVVS